MLGLFVKSACPPNASVARAMTAARCATGGALLRRGLATETTFSQATWASVRGSRSPAVGAAGGAGGLDARGAFRAVVSVAIAGATAVVVEDTLNDLVLWRICKSHAMPVIDSHPRLHRSLVGEKESQNKCCLFLFNGVQRNILFRRHCLC